MAMYTDSFDFSIRSGRASVEAFSKVTDNYNGIITTRASFTYEDIITGIQKSKVIQGGFHDSVRLGGMIWYIIEDQDSCDMYAVTPNAPIVLRYYDDEDKDLTVSDAEHGEYYRGEVVDHISTVDVDRSTLKWMWCDKERGDRLYVININDTASGNYHDAIRYFVPKDGYAMN